MQIIIWKFLQSQKGYDVSMTKNWLLFLIMIQYIPRFARFIPLTSEMKRTAGVFAETAWAGAAYYLLWFLLASHVSSDILYCNYFIKQRPLLIYRIKVKRSHKSILLIFVSLLNIL